VVTPVGIEQRLESLPEVRAAAAVGVGPVGTQQVAVVVVPEGGRTSRLPTVAPLDLADRVRAVAGTDVAAVLVMAALPVDIRHGSKVDRTDVAEAVSAVLAGSRPGGGRSGSRRRR
jgi:acyl-coenzyme A synthetase/AMP-(fatty) acid ligase